jgi:molecular chaperone GrpE
MSDETKPPASASAADTPPTPAEPLPPPTPEQRIAELEAILADERDKFLRKAADFENIRRRLTAESQRAAEAKKLDFIQQALAIADNLAIALLTPADKETVEHLSNGVRLTLDKFNQLLRDHGVEKFVSLDQPFDPHRHEAVSMQKIPDKPDHTVVQVYREGYLRGDQVFRYAQVVVNQL